MVPLRGLYIQGDEEEMGLALDFADAAVLSNTDECIIWPFTTQAGYGALKKPRDRKNYAAHRYVCEQAHGKPADGLHAAHSCGVRRCVNPRHLRWATHSENMKDRLIHGTHDRGERHKGHKLTQEQVNEIIALRGIESGKSLATRLGVSRALICRIQLGNNWKWVHLKEAA